MIPAQTRTVRSARHHQVIAASLRVDGASEAALREVMQTFIAWEALYRQALHHGIFPLLYTRMMTLVPDLIPPTVQGTWHAAYRATTQRVMRLLVDLVTVTRALEAHGIRVVAVKGLADAHVLYGDPTLRHFSDLDILVTPQALMDARQVLLDLGLCQVAGDPTGMTPIQVRQTLQTQREWHFKFAHRPDLLEVHWRLADKAYPLVLPVDEVMARCISCDIGGHPIHVLDADDRVIALAHHATKHCWAKWRQVSDFATAVAMSTPDRWLALLARAKAQGVRRPVLLGIAVAHHLLALPVPEEVLAEVRRDRGMRKMVRWVEEGLMRRADRVPDSFEVMLFSFHLTERPFQTVISTLRTMVTPTRTDHQWRPLPRWLWWLYPVLRPFRQAGKVWRILRRRQVSPE